MLTKWMEKEGNFFFFAICRAHIKIDVSNPQVELSTVTQHLTYT